MNRRSFFKAVTGFVAGVFAAFVPNSKSIRVSNGLAHLEGEKVDILTLSAKDWVDAQFNPVKELRFGEPFEGKIVSMCNFEGTLWIATERGVYRIKGISS